MQDHRSFRAGASLRRVFARSHADASTLAVHSNLILERAARTFPGLGRFRHPRRPTTRAAPTGQQSRNVRSHLSFPGALSDCPTSRMPPDDPALPPGSNSLKRETAVRLFHTLVHIDSLLSDSATFRCYVSFSKGVGDSS